MNNEWKMVPAALLDRALLSVMEQGIEVDGQYELVEIQKAPVPPAGDVEVLASLGLTLAVLHEAFNAPDSAERLGNMDVPRVMRGAFGDFERIKTEVTRLTAERGGLKALLAAPMPPAVESVLRTAADGTHIRISADGSIEPVPPAGDVEVPELMDIPEPSMAYQYRKGWNGCHAAFTPIVTRLTAERDAMGSKVESMRRKNNELNDTEARLTADLAKALEDLRLEKVASAAMQQQAENFKALSWDRGQELTKARGLLLAIPRRATNLGARIDAFLKQSAPAAKGGSDE